MRRARIAGRPKTLRAGPVALAVLKGVDLALPRGEIAALVGPSGAGKSTLLHVAGLLERPNNGAIPIDGRDCGGLADGPHRAASRAIGFVYQFHHLLPEFSALENVMLPQLIAGVPRGAARAQAAMLLGGSGWANGSTTARPAVRRRAATGAIVRALANARICLADEPTGNLDHRPARK